MLTNCRFGPPFLLLFMAHAFAQSNRLARFSDLKLCMWTRIQPSFMLLFTPVLFCCDMSKMFQMAGELSSSDSRTCTWACPMQTSSFKMFLSRFCCCAPKSQHFLSTFMLLLRMREKWDTTQQRSLSRLELGT